MTAAEYCYRHPDVETGVHCTRCGRAICPRCMIPASVGFHCPECVAEGRRTTRTARTIYGGRARPGQAPGLVTRTLIGINVVVFIVTAASGANVLTGSTGKSTIYDRFALIPIDVAHGQWYRLITAAFLHYGILHIGFNMFALWSVGPQLEAALGRLRYATLYVLAGIGGSVLSLAIGPAFEQAAGASGAIFGLFAAFYVIARHLNLNAGPIATTIVINLVLTFSLSNIDWRGHVGGLVTGAAIAAVFAFAPHGPARARYQAAGVAVVAAVLAVGGLIAAHHTYDKCPDLITRNSVPIGCGIATFSPLGPGA
ncbi:MAG TPA: rhomboid family intramembrane serine protease [Mycobacteriales bacterium]|nr:rhomboid family intramembrane serine protease [Mycobacteriales bacterium]